MTSDAALRWVRALALSSVLFFSGLAGHAAGDGVIPATSVLAPLFVITAVVVALLTRTGIRPAPVVALLIGGQGLLHAALQLLSGTAVATTVMCGTGMDAMAAPSPTSCHLMTHSGVASHDLAMPLMSGGHLVMLGAHLAAAAIAGAWLVAGERTLWMALVFAARSVVDAWRTGMAVVRGGCVMVCNDPRPQLGWGPPCAVRDQAWAAGAVSRRGPPIAASA